MKPTVRPSWKPIRALDLAALTLGGLLALLAYSLSRGEPSASPSPWLVAGNGPERKPFGFARAREQAGMRRFQVPEIPPRLLVAPEGFAVPAPGMPLFLGSITDRPTDRCLVTIPVNDPGFVVSVGSDIDSRMIVAPRVVGLPVGSGR